MDLFCSKIRTMNTNKEYPKSFSHIGITVPDLEKAVEF